MKKNLVLLAIVVIMCLIPFFLPVNKKAEFGGSDSQAEDAITASHPNYKPWFESFFEPASSEVESLLFTLQGSLGTGVICYILGYYRGKRRLKTDVRN